MCRRIPISVLFLLCVVMGGLLRAAEPTSTISHYPQRAITIIVPWAAGGPSDTLSRFVANHMSPTLNQQVVVENVFGAGGTIASLRVKRAAPDGYTILIGNPRRRARAVF
jgi:putative tricarboxylic transport membrane protein